MQICCFVGFFSICQTTNLLECLIKTGRWTNRAPCLPKRSVSRVLFPALVAHSQAAIIHLGRSLPNASCGSPGSLIRRAAYTAHLKMDSSSLFSLAPGGVYHAAFVTEVPVRSYRTFSPLPRRTRAVYFLWHFPWDRSHRGLPGTLPCGARTFLPRDIPAGDRLGHSDLFILPNILRSKQAGIASRDNRIPPRSYAMRLRSTFETDPIRRPDPRYRSEA